MIEKFGIPVTYLNPSNLEPSNTRSKIGGNEAYVIDKIDKYIEDSIEVWNFERVGSVERALLRYAVYEIKFSDIGVEIIINEAVELAKRYGEEKSSEFINGVLAKIAKK